MMLKYFLKPTKVKSIWILHKLHLVFDQPNEAGGLTGAPNPSDKSGEEEAEAEADHRVRPEHLAVHKPDVAILFISY